MSSARKVGDFYEVDGFIVYENYVETCPWTHEPNLTRRELLETEDEQQAKDLVAQRHAADPADTQYVYYERGRILV